MLTVQERQSLHLFATLPTTYPITVLLFCLALAALAALYAARQVQFISGRSDLIASEKRHAQLYKEYASEFMGLDRLLVVVEPTDEQQGKEFVTRLETFWNVTRDT